MQTEADGGAGEIAEPSPVQAGEELRRHEVDDVEEDDDRQAARHFDVADGEGAQEAAARDAQQRE